MRTRIIIAAGVIAAAAILAGGCSRDDARSLSPSRLLASGPVAPGVEVATKPDSMPGPNPPPPQGPQQNLSLQFTGADSVSAGQTANTRWLFGNSGHSSLTVSWTLTDGHGWPGLPQQGTVDLAPLSTQSVVIAVVVPDTAQAGDFDPLHMTATPQHGQVVTADGGILVFGGTPPSDSLVTGRR